MGAGGPVDGTDGRDDGTRGPVFAGSDTPTPPSGFPMPDMRGSEEPTPPAGISGLVGPDGVIGQGVVEPEDFGQAGPAVLGAPEHASQEPREEATDWPKLEYRSRAKSQRTGAMDWLRRRDDA